MTDREKRLVYMLTGAAFVVVNLGVYKKVYEVRSKAADSKLVAAQATLSQATTLIETREIYETEMKWLGQNEPKRSSVQQAQTKLQQLVQSYAKGQGLTTKSTKLQTSITDPGLNYHRVRIQVEVNGMEQALFRFLTTLHSPKDSRAVTLLRLNPQKSDDTRIDCQVMIEQWFTPDDGEDNPIATK